MCAEEKICDATKRGDEAILGVWIPSRTVFVEI